MNRRKVVFGRAARFSALCGICALPLASIAFLRHRNSPNARFNRQLEAGNKYFKSENYQQAAVEYTQLITLQPHRSEGYLLRAIAYHKLGENEKAIEDNTTVIQMNPSAETAGDAHYNLGIVYAVQRDYKRALAQYDLVLGSVPNTSEMIAGRAACYRLQGNPVNGTVQSESDYRANTPKFGQYVSNGNYHIYKQAYTEAEKDFGRAIAARPCDPVGWTNLAWAKFLRGDVAKAITTDKTAIKIDPTFSVSRFNMGLYYAVQNRLDDANSQYSAGLQTASRWSISNAVDDIDPAKKRFTEAAPTLDKIQNMMKVALKSAPIYGQQNPGSD